MSKLKLHDNALRDVLTHTKVITVVRHEIIEQVKAGRIKAILSTSSLEAGIDLPSLDWCLVRGWPGSLMSFRQRIGRAGRGNNPGLVIFLPVATSPLDKYYSTNPNLLIFDQIFSLAKILARLNYCGFRN